MIDAKEFRAALGRFASGVTVVTTRDATGAHHGLTVSAFCSLSLDPPLVLVCIDKRAASHMAFRESGAYVVNLLADSQEGLSRAFSSRVVDRFAGIAHTPGVAGIPVLDGALASIECTLAATHDAGDHTIYVGAVEKVTVRDAQPLVYFSGRYARLAPPTL